MCYAAGVKGLIVWRGWRPLPILISVVQLRSNPRPQDFTSRCSERLCAVCGFIPGDEKTKNQNSLPYAQRRAARNPVQDITHQSDAGRRVIFSDILALNLLLDRALQSDRGTPRRAKRRLQIGSRAHQYLIVSCGDTRRPLEPLKLFLSTILVFS